MRWPGARGAPANGTRVTMRAPETDLPLVLADATILAGKLTDPRPCVADLRHRRADRADRPERRRQDNSAARGDGPHPADQRPHHLGRPRAAPRRRAAPSCSSGRSCCAARPPPISATRSPTTDAPRAQRIDELLTLVGLAGMGARPARRLSGGEQQRLALARALARDPAILFLDEPTASLDPASTKAIEDIVRAVSARGVKVVMSTHDLGQARRLAGDVVLLHRGRLIEHGPRAGIFRKAAHRRGTANSSPANCWSNKKHPGGSHMLNRRALFIAATRARPRHHRACLRTGQIHRRRLDHVDAGFRPVRISAAFVQGQDRHHREGDLARHRPGARHRPPRRCRRRLRACQIGRRKIPRRRLRREADPGHVQRLRADRAEERSGRHQGHARTSPRRWSPSRTRSADFISRGDKSGTHVAELALWKAAGVDIEKDKGAWYKAIGQGMGAALNTAGAVERLRPVRPRHLAQLQKQRRARHSGRRRQAPVQPVRRHAGEPGQASDREEGPRPGSSSTG